ncbi:MAG: hypothetical protein WC708_15085 [Lentisphaeria bacterium]
MNASELSPAHRAAVNRRRRILIQYDAMDPNTLLGTDFAAWLKFRFHYLDDPGSQADSIIWDVGWGNCAVYPSRVLPPNPNRAFGRWWEAGIDFVGRLVDETHQRGLEAFWNHRISEVDIRPELGLEMRERFSVKAEHPDWVLKTWWWQGLWNLASPGLRAYKVAILRELAEQYDFDGFQIDFSRHLPCLPVGRQWALRGHVTRFLRQVRRMLQDVAGRRGRPILLAAKVPETLDACRADGFDIAAWAGENLVDFLSLGSRTMAVDVAGYRRLVTGRNIKLYPCLDDHHATDGYRFPPIEVFRGIFGNWLAQGADGVETFNWSSTDPATCRRLKVPAGPKSQRQAYRECGDLKTMAGKRKTFCVERRGGYPWGEGEFGQNKHSPLPALLANDGREALFTVYCHDVPGRRRCKTANVLLRLVLFGALRTDDIAAELNGHPLVVARRDFTWKDGQIFSPQPQPDSGMDMDAYPIDPQQRLLRLDLTVPAKVLRAGDNRVAIRVAGRGIYPVCQNIQLEKVEIQMRLGNG